MKQSKATFQKNSQNQFFAPFDAQQKSKKNPISKQTQKPETKSSLRAYFIKFLQTTNWLALL